MLSRIKIHIKKPNKTPQQNKTQHLRKCESIPIENVHMKKQTFLVKTENLSYFKFPHLPLKQY